MLKSKHVVLVTIALLVIDMPIFVDAGQVHARDERPSALDYVPPMPGLVKLYYRVNPEKPSQRRFSDVSIMDETRGGLTGFYLYASGRDGWTFQRLLTACDFFSIYREIDGELSVSSAPAEALERCSQTWPLRAGDTVPISNDVLLRIDDLATETLIIDGVAHDRLVYVERRDTANGNIAMRYSAQGVGTYRIDMKEGPGFGAELLVFDHDAQGHILGRCMESGPMEACLCAAIKAPTWLSSETLDAVVDGVQLAWSVDTLEPVTRRAEIAATAIDDVRRQSVAACEVDLTGLV